MLTISRRPSQRWGRLRPRFDRLEVRVALASGGVSDPTDSSSDAAPGDFANPTQGPSFGVDLIDPAPGSIRHDSPAALTLQFSHPIYPDTLSNDVGIVQTDADGNLTGWYTVPERLALDSSAARLAVDLGVILPPGHYQVWVFGSTGIINLDGNSLASPDGETLILGSFEVSVAGTTLADAVDLASPGSTPIVVPGYLDFEADPLAVSLYRIQLDPGHFWRLGLEVTAERDGGTLDTALALFDEQGRPIAVAETGRKDAPKDPFLFTGLTPGIYYVGVSGTGNLPGPLGGYDPAAGLPGRVPQVQPGGGYALHLVADPVDSPPLLRSFTIDHADAHSSNPTGLTLGLSRTIALPGPESGLSPALSRGIEVEDQDGRTWPVLSTGYDEAEARVSYVFIDPLSPGHYTVRLPSRGGIVDLAGLSPVAAGEPPGVLGSFDVPVADGPDDPHDLGALLPDAAVLGRSIPWDLEPGQTGSYRIVVTVPALYHLAIRADGTVPSVRIEGAGLSRLLDAGGTNDTLLAPGEYFLRIQADGPEAVHGRLDFRSAAVEPELLLANGVGQGPGLSLRLIAVSGGTLRSPSAPPISIPTPDPVLMEAPIFLAPMAAIAPITLVSSPSARGSGDPFLGPNSSRSRTASVAMISFLRLGTTDLIGRPSPGNSRREGAEPGRSASRDITSRVGFPPGPLQSLAGGLRMSLDRGRLDATDVVLAAVAGLEPGVAVGTAPELSRRAPGIGDFPNRIVRLRTAAESAGTEPPGSDGPETQDSAGILGALAIRADHAEDPSDDHAKGEPIDGAESWAEFLAPAMAAVSAVLVAELGRRAARWWRSRIRRRGEQKTEHVPPDSPAIERPPADSADLWTDASDLVATGRPVSRAS